MGYLKYLVLISQIGLSVIAPMVAGIWLGGILDKQFHGRGFIALFMFILGIGSGCVNAYNLIMHSIKKRD